MAGAVIRVTETGAAATTDEQGAFESAGLPAGSYEVLAERPPLAVGRQVVTVAPGATALADFALQVAVQESAWSPTPASGRPPTPSSTSTYASRSGASRNCT